MSFVFNLIAYASRLCTDKSRWETRSHYELCIGCSPDDALDSVGYLS